MTFSSKLNYFPNIAREDDTLHQKRINNIVIDDVSCQKHTKEYETTFFLKDGKEHRFFVKQWREEVDEKIVWKFKIYDIKEDRTILKDMAFAMDSYYWTDEGGIHMHFGPKDKMFLKMNPDAAAMWIDAVIANVCSETRLYATLFVKLLTIKMEIGLIESGEYGNTHVFISWNYSS